MLTDVTRRFGSLVAVDDVSLTIGRGEVVGLLGHNGAGKTTLIRLINGILTPHAGSIRVHGHDPVTEGQAVRKLTGVVNAFPGLDELLTSFENLRTFGRIHGLDGPSSSRRADELLERLGLTDRRDTPCNELSVGLKQRVALARALMHDPDVLLLDEPTSNMDPVAANQVRALILELNQDRPRAVALCTHNLAEAQAVCDRVAILREGALLAVGSPSDLATELAVASTRIVVASEHVERALATLETATTVPEPSTIEVNGGMSAPEAVRRLVAADVDVHRVEPRLASLEDVYLHLHA